MNKQNTKEKLLKEIEDLISYGKNKSTIDPSLLQYLEINDLENIKKKLEAKKDILTTEDKEWLEQFKKYD